MEAAFRTKDIGARSGKLLFFGGVYGNLQALQVMQQTAVKEGIPAQNIFCTGDVVGYCAQPTECIALIRDWGIHCIAGNVEIQLRNGEDDCGCNFNEDGRCDLASRNWYAYAKKHASEAELNWMNGLPDFIHFRYAGRKCAVLHGSAFQTAGYIFASTDWSEKKSNFEAQNADIIIAGHCGLPFFQEADNLCWLNAGVIGMPANDGDTRVWYAMMATDGAGNIEASLHQLAYDYESAAALMRTAGLPQQYALALTTGIWDNCEILPEAETRAQGKKIAPSLHKIRCK